MTRFDFQLLTQRLRLIFLNESQRYQQIVALRGYNHCKRMQKNVFLLSLYIGIISEYDLTNDSFNPLSNDEMNSIISWINKMFNQLLNVKF